jgi:hypothetical protein
LRIEDSLPFAAGSFNARVAEECTIVDTEGSHEDCRKVLGILDLFNDDREKKQYD